MTIHQFGALFKAFKIYPSSAVEEFLSSYQVQQGIKINDPTWHSFISEVVSRFCGAKSHFFLLDFLKLVAARYVMDSRQTLYVMDLLQLKVPKLFAIEEETNETDEKEDVEVRRNFSAFLWNFINRNALKHSILTNMTTILVHGCLLCLPLEWN